MKNSPIFILGSERSGSNLLRTLVSNHSNIEGPISPHFLDSFWEYIDYYGDLRIRENGNKLFDDMLKLSNHPYNNWQLDIKFEEIYAQYTPTCFLDYFNILYLEKALKHEKNRYICKSNHVFKYIDPLMEHFPNAKFIYLVRNPRDHVTSWMKKPLFIKTPYDAIMKWNDEQDKCQFILKTKEIDSFIVRYEDIIEDTPKVMSRVLQFLEEPVEEVCFNTDQTKNEDVKWNKYWENLSKPVMNKNKGKYKELFNTKTINMIETKAKQHMLDLDYSFDTSSNWRKPLLFSFTLKFRRKYIGYKYQKHIQQDMSMLHSKIALLDEMRSQLKITS